jgi:hypothetical protein
MTTPDRCKSPTEADLDGARPRPVSNSISRKTRLLLLGAGLTLLLCDIGGFLYWRRWAWGNQLFNGPKGRVEIQRQGRPTYASRREVLKEAETHFSFQGRPIHPAIINAFSSWLSDSDTAVMAVDVAAATDSNQYGQEVKTYPGGLHEVTLQTDPDNGRASTFTYRYLGTLRTGVQVLETFDCGGGSGQFMYLLFLRCEVLTVGGEDRLLLKFMDRFSLGDRFTGEIKLRGDSVCIEAQPLNPYHGLQESTNYSPIGNRW